MSKNNWYGISADNGESWTFQLLNQTEAEEEKRSGYIVVEGMREFYKDLRMEQQEQM